MQTITPMTPVLYSFRRCPYAMRARLAVDRAKIQTHLREIVLRDKPQAFLDASTSATVPCLVTETQTIDESLDIMIWALSQHDPEGWLDMPELGHELIKTSDGPFKDAIDRTKYASRYPSEDPNLHRGRAVDFITVLDRQIDHWLFDRPTLADFAILPFVRQFAFIDKAWFDAQDWPNLQAWLARFIASDAFERIMIKHTPWRPNDPPVKYPA